MNRNGITTRIPTREEGIKIEYIRNENNDFVFCKDWWVKHISDITIKCNERKRKIEES